MDKLMIKDEKQTKEFGLRLADRLVPGSIVALIGNLGTGKTALTKYIAEGLGIKETITSPTFTIVQEYYDGRLPLYHFDVYRINDVEEMFELGYEEYFFGKGVCIVEWADLISEIIPEDAIVINISYGENEGERIYEITGLEAGL
ncbi:tRNA (adenosine(37)-N6)-threonylcarbamoyltransferase complex ATPase subunit type 1 TsaE [Aminipila sp.]|jgi:tRNA threonylcarbamoyladenosine biosynthesis protein TsaE|uniref:tRNA (adenosine(37)-N6)-threonylcarbamoyltransferase complex ATPase subunit type 1 TsaE n=1 Tax=Aminipila sp. TaxID=2060095 RepID=UPI002898447E|nr:tRNA (adenosine(37)-N6)-threonylcarbamoyltransferase complex ATPase subunit type 1 TsaE [Aminipila sp.]